MEPLTNEKVEPPDAGATIKIDDDSDFGFEIDLLSMEIEDVCDVEIDWGFLERDVLFLMQYRQRKREKALNPAPPIEIPTIFRRDVNAIHALLFKTESDRGDDKKLARAYAHMPDALEKLSFIRAEEKKIEVFQEKITISETIVEITDDEAEEIEFKVDEITVEEDEFSAEEERNAIPDSAEALILGHRNRVKQKIIDSGVESLAPYQVLEYLLYGCIPMVDTKPLAKTLLKKYGSLAKVMANDYKTLRKDDKLPESAALFLSSMPGIFHVTWQSQAPDIVCDDAIGLLPFIEGLFLGQEQEECMFLLAIDRQRRMTRTFLLASGSQLTAEIYLKELAEVLVEHKTTYAILAHNHPSGNPIPSKSDIKGTLDAKAIMDALNVRLLDHIIIGNRLAYSFFYRSIFYCQNGHVVANIAEENGETDALQRAIFGDADRIIGKQNASKYNPAPTEPKKPIEPNDGKRIRDAYLLASKLIK